MGRSHSKVHKSPTLTVTDRAPLSPRQKLRRDSDKRKQKKFSFGKKKSKLDNLKMPRLPPAPDGSEILNEAEAEIEIKRHMQDQLAFNSEIFVLNQMMMSVQFFANYERFEQFALCKSIVIRSPSSKCPRKYQSHTHHVQHLNHKIFYSHWLSCSSCNLTQLKTNQF